MKQFYFAAALLCSLVFKPFNTLAGVPAQDSLALVDLYNSTDGLHWTAHNNWQFFSPVETWAGVFVKNGHVSSIVLDNSNLSGTLPTSLGNLDSLTYLNLGNNHLNGDIPASLGNCSLLSQLHLFFNNLSGSIPASFGNFSNLTSLTLNHNSLTGSIPASIGNLTKLANLSLLDNQLTGALPNELGNLIDLQSLNVSNNNLSGPLPASVGNLINLTQLSLSFNQIAGSIPATLSNCTQLTVFFLDHNQFSGGIPASLGSLSNVLYLDLSFNMLTGSIPAELGQLSSAQAVRLNHNGLTGSIPASLGNLSQATILVLNENQLTGTIPTELSNITLLYALDLSYNLLTGSIPSSLNQLTSLAVFSLAHNALSGPIPDLSNLLSLQTLNLESNTLSGAVPTSFSNLANLRTLILSNNQLTGPIPGFLGNIPYLQVLKLDHNKLRGPIPAGLSQTTPFPVLYIQNNQFSFAGIESLVNAFGSSPSFIYAPQDSLRLALNNNTLSVAAGGMPSRNTYKWYKNGSLIATKTGDSTLAMSGGGDYYVSVSNSTAVMLTLVSRHHIFDDKQQLSQASCDVEQNIHGNAAIDINDSNFNRVLSIVPGNLEGDVLFSVAINPGTWRSYSVTPSNNAAGSNATLILYFTQQDFDDYNNYVSSNHLPNSLLPSSGADNGNTRIVKTDGGTVTDVIAPTVAWDAANNWWTATFPVTGFSDFSISTISNALPLHLLQFTGSLLNNTVQLHWLTTNEINTDEFIVQVSSDGNQFKSIGKITAMSTPGNHDYLFADVNYPATKVYYRLQMTDKDGRSVFSNVIIIRTANEIVADKLYPNPARYATTLQFNVKTAGMYNISIDDVSGKTIKNVGGYSVKGNNQVLIGTQGLLPGRYSVTLSFADGTIRSWLLCKQ